MWWYWCGALREGNILTFFTTYLLLFFSFFTTIPYRAWIFVNTEMSYHGNVIIPHLFVSLGTSGTCNVVVRKTPQQRLNGSHPMHRKHGRGGN
jgi:hypothetical protein